MTTSRPEQQHTVEGVRGPVGRLDRADQVAFELVRNGSIELTSSDPGRVAEAAELLPYGTSVYLPRHRRRSYAEILELMRVLHEEGFNPVPHLAARLIASRGELRAFLASAVSECGVHRTVVIGGDQPRADGPYADSASILREGILADSGIRQVAIAGYPEGHPRIPPGTLREDFETKLALASEQGIGVDVLTQFSFVPSRIVDYCSMLKKQSPDTSVYVGMAGPTNAARLLRFARKCGVSASLRALSDLGVKAAKLSSHTEPGEQLAVLARHCALEKNSNVIGVHLFSFGGFVESARWMRRQCRLH